MNKRFLEACRGKSTDRPPVWFMRQAGRYQPEYRKIKETKNIIDIIHDPDLCARVTELPIKQLGVDAAILFSDIMTPMQPMGIQNEIKANYGPYIPNPVREEADVERIKSSGFEPGLKHVDKTIKILKQKLDVPLIGFSGAPFTLASYIIEGGKSKNYEYTKLMMFNTPELWNELMEKLKTGMLNYLKLQVEAGVDAVQLFDSWVGQLSYSDYQKYVLPHMQSMFAEIKKWDVPSIHFAVNNDHLLSSFNTANSDVIGVDWRIKLAEAATKTNHDTVLQGNLDPVSVLCRKDVLKDRVEEVLKDAEQADIPSYIFNLGHGVLPNFETEKLKYVVDIIKGKSS